MSIECQADMLWEYWKSLTRDIALIYLFILQTSIEAHVRLIDLYFKLEEITKQVPD